MHIVFVIVVMGVDGYAAPCLHAEQGKIFGMLAHHLGVSRAADMMVETDHLVCRFHHHVEIVGNHQHAAAVAIAHGGDKPIKLRLADHIDPLERLIEHQKIGPAQQRPSEKNTPPLAAGDALNRGVDQMPGADLVKDVSDAVARRAAGQGQEAGHRKGHAVIHLHALRHVADAKPAAAKYASPAGREKPDDDPHQGRFAGPVGTDERHNLAVMNREIHALKNVPPLDMRMNAGSFDQGNGSGGRFSHRRGRRGGGQDVRPGNGNPGAGSSLLPCGPGGDRFRAPLLTALRTETLEFKGPAFNRETDS